MGGRQSLLQASRTLRLPGGVAGELSSLPPGRYEQIEKLEQLRVLENGYDIMVGLTEDPTIGVDTPEDAKRFEEALADR